MGTWGLPGRRECRGFGNDPRADSLNGRSVMTVMPINCLEKINVFNAFIDDFNFIPRSGGI
jgi:hypothetical protein